MIGGKVIETIVCGDRVWINCEDRFQTCAIYVQNDCKARAVSEGDIVWWQAGKAMWTAKDRYGKTVGKPDTILTKIGFSHSKSRPTISPAACVSQQPNRTSPTGLTNADSEPANHQ